MATEFIHNAKQIHLDLIRGDWAIKREVVYKAQISEQEKVNQRQAGELKLEKEKTGKLTTERDTLKQQLGEQTLKTKQARLEIWVMRLAAALYLAGKIKGVLP